MSATKQDIPGVGLAVVTGATGNLGRAVIARLERMGTRVIAVERSQVRHAGESIAEIDLGQYPSAQAAFARMVDRFGRLDAVVHTVGTYRGGSPLLETPSEDFKALFETNVIATAHVLRAALSVMLPVRYGRIAVVGSTAALTGTAGQSAYAASKAAQLRLIESAAHEARDSGVAINVVLPTTMDTPENRAAMPKADRSRWLSLDAVAEVLAYLVSPAASAIHGEAIRLGQGV